MINVLTLSLGDELLIPGTGILTLLAVEGEEALLVVSAEMPMWNALLKKLAKRTRSGPDSVLVCFIISTSAVDPSTITKDCHPSPDNPASPPWRGCCFPGMRSWCSSCCLPRKYPSVCFPPGIRQGIP